ncbi:Flp family type IVb pilin [Candidatus Poriferisodalis sp.]|uniref:Flp family type IVb pilin n=1 Tax=Candidatus Poriferisodalis sp. TaxID=3101277 RepID=UPI003B0166D0
MPERSTTRHSGPHAQARRTHRLDADQAAATKPTAAADEAGQTTAEYALLTGAIALLVAAVTAWATSTGKIGRLLDAVFNYLTKAIS